MADIVFPNIGNALTSGLQARALMDHNDQTQQRKALAPDVSAAIGGNSEALGRVAAVDPDYALKIGPILDRLDANKQAVLKRAADFTTSMGMGILNSPPEHRAAAYEAARAEAKRMNIPTESWPQQWDPRAEGWLTFNVHKAVPVAKWFEETEKNKREGLTPMNQGGASPTMATGGGPANAIGGIESGGQPNGGYGAVGPVANAQGNRAYGKYQVMDFNVGPWTQEVFGKAMSPQEFLANPQAQDAVFKAKFGQYSQKYGPEGASRAWFAGEGGMNNPNAADVNGMTVQKYGQQFVANGGAGPQPAAGPQVAQAQPQGGFQPTNTPAQSVPGAVVNMAPPQGDSVRGDASGNPMQVGQEFRDLQSKLPPGYRLAMQGRQLGKAPDGYVAVFPPGVSDPRAVTYVEVPKPQQTQKPTPPTGMRFTAQGGVEWLPGYQESQEQLARGKRELKAIPASENDKLSMNVSLIGSIDKALEAYGDVGKPSGRFAGTLSQYGGGAGRQVAATIDKEGQPARAAIANVASTLLQARSGLAVTEGEYNRLAEMLPQASDDPDIIRSKLKDIRDTYTALTKDQAAQYSEKNGYISHSGVDSLRGGKAPSKASPSDQGRAQFDANKAPDGATATGPNGEKWIKRNGNWGPMQ